MSVNLMKYFPDSILVKIKFCLPLPPGPEGGGQPRQWPVLAPHEGDHTWTRASVRTREFPTVPGSVSLRRWSVSASPGATIMSRDMSHDVMIGASPVATMDVTLASSLALRRVAS